MFDCGLILRAHCVYANSSKAIMQLPVILVLLIATSNAVDNLYEDYAAFGEQEVELV